MLERFVGRVQRGEGNASHWLSLFNDAYADKTGMTIFPGSLNLALHQPFDWFAKEVSERTIFFGREEYGGERDILLVACFLESLDDQSAFLWTTTTAARERSDPHVVEVLAPVNLRDVYSLQDGDEVTVRLAISSFSEWKERRNRRNSAQ